MIINYTLYVILAARVSCCDGCPIVYTRLYNVDYQSI